LQHYLAFELWAELPSLAHVTFPLLDYDTAFSSVSNLRGSLQFTLGFNIASYFVSGLLLISPPFSVWLFRALVVIMFLIGQRLIKHIRNHYTYNPCSDCPLGSFPTCEWNLPRLLEANPEFGMFLKTDD
jgi:hypothetical protein